MRICQLITRADAGGAQRIAAELAAYQAAAGHEVWLAYGRGAEAGLPWLEAAAEAGARLEPLALVHPLRPLRDLLAVRALARWLRRERIEALVTHTSKAGAVGRLAGWLAGVPVIHVAHGWAFHPGQGWLARRAYQAIERRMARITRRIVAVSEATRARGLAAGVGAPEQVVVRYCGVDAAGFARATPDPRRPLVLGVACLKPQKDPLTSVRIAAAVAREHPTARFELVGDGPLRADVERAIASEGLGERLRLIGWDLDVATRLARASALLLSSRFEGLPLVVLEAMAAGVPVVATAVDGTPEAVVEGESGLLFAPGDVAGGAAQLLRALREPELRARLIAGADRRLAERFDRASFRRAMTQLVADEVGP